MKMIIAIVKDHDADPVTQALTNENFRVTRIASTGGFLRSGVATLLEALRLLIDQPRAAELRFLFPDAEELGMLGAKAYLARWGKPALVINLDTVGRPGVMSYRQLRDPAAADPRLLIHWRAAPAGDPLDAALDAALLAQGFHVQAGEGPMFARAGDHWVFAEAGVPAHFLFGGFAGTADFLSDVWPLNVRVIANSPSLWPTMFSDT